MPLDKYKCPEFILQSAALSNFAKYAAQNPASEQFGLLFCSPTAVQLRTYENTAPDTTNYFAANSMALRDAHRAIAAGQKLIICHSHPAQHPSHFSPNDISTIHQWNAAGLLLHGEGFKDHAYYDSVGESPLEGRPWRPVESNCYTLLRDALKQQSFDLDAAFSREAIRAQIQFDSIFDLMYRIDQVTVWAIAAKVMQKVGERSSWFKPGVIRKGDALMFAPTGGWPTHLGIMGNPADNLFLHHRENGISKWTAFDEHWRSSLSGVFRVPAGPIHYRSPGRLAS